MQSVHTMAMYPRWIRVIHTPYPEHEGVWQQPVAKGSHAMQRDEGLRCAAGSWQRKRTMQTSRCERTLRSCHMHRI
jgi:hypothetical protein